MTSGDGTQKGTQKLQIAGDSGIRKKEWLEHFDTRFRHLTRKSSISEGKKGVLDELMDYLSPKTPKRQ